MLVRFLLLLPLAGIFPLYSPVVRGDEASIDPVTQVDPMVGTAPTGHAYPGATVPFGLVQVSPDTRSSGWEACAGYDHDDKTILGFSNTHLTGTGCLDLGDVLLMPVVGSLHLDTGHLPDDFKSGFTHVQEMAQPGYYKVFLQDPKVLVELTATARVGMQRYTFPDSNDAHVILDTVHGIGCADTESELRKESDTVISGHRKTHGWASSGREVFFVIEFSRPFRNLGFDRDGTIAAGGVDKASGKAVKGYVDFQTQAAQPLLVKVAISGTSVEEAHKNMASELPGWDFDAVRRAASRQWSDALSVIQVESSNPELVKTFYTNLYQAMQAPILFNDADGTYRGQDQKNHAYTNFQRYTELSLWDIYRAESPLLTLIQPARVPDFASTMLADYQQLNQHALPKWPLWGNETWCMIGYHAVPVIVDAYFKGLVRPDEVKPLYEAMRDTAMQDREGLDAYKKDGYIPMGHGDQTVSRTMECAFDDACIARMAQALGRDEDHAIFEKRSQNYRNLYDPSTKFMRAKSVDGKWRDPFEPRLSTAEDYTEGDAWQYAFAVQQDVPDLVRLMGGDGPFIQKLDDMFAADPKIINGTQDDTGLLGQYSQGDEQCHHVAYLYNYAGAPWKTQERVREVMTKMYGNTPDGQCGNIDCGEMNAWYILSAMGLFPVNPVTGVYVLGSPILDRTTLHLDSGVYHGKTFTVVAANNSPQNIYIQSATLNGAPLTRSWITHAEITSGGELDLVMGPQPNKQWGSAPEDRPPAGFPGKLSGVVTP